MFAVGDIIQARSSRKDRLFYDARVEEVDDKKHELVVRFDDDGDQQRINFTWAIKGSKKIIHIEEALDGEPLCCNVIVSEGYLWSGIRTGSNGETKPGKMKPGPRRARLLSFESSPKLYQSGVIIREDDRGYDWTHIYEPEQALLLCLCLVDFDICKMKTDGTRHQVLILGGGGATLPMAMLQFLPPTISCDVVELHGAIIRCAQKYFGAQHEHFTTHQSHGLAYLSECKDAMYSAILVDVCSSNAEDGAPLELPPAEFVLKDNLSKSHAKLCDGGIFGMNVLADAQHLEDLTNNLRNIFGNVYILATDPNYFLFSKKGGKDVNIEPSEVISLAISHGLMDVCEDVLGEVALTSHYRDDETLIGWLHAPEFLERMKVEKV
eukprot:m.7920 g.7920  ORF g.7920 m.7920 type:complete len:380 (+) comp3800_c0_seq2:266-1405(+)